MSDSEHVAWAEFARLILPMPGRSVPQAMNHTAPAVKVPDAEPGAAPPVRLRKAAIVARDRELEIGQAPGGLDKANWHRLRTGRLLPSRTLDLHGRTAQRAYDALQAFLRSAQADGVRCVEVITGRGGTEGTGVIRRELPHWLNQPPLRGLVLGAAHPHAANPGSVRLLLRRAR